MAEYGRVVNVAQRRFSDDLDVAADAGDGFLVVTDTSDFLDIDGTPRVLIGEETHTITSVDDDASTIYIDGTLADSYPEGETVFLVPETYDLRAYVESGTGEEAMSCRVPHVFEPLLPVGTRGYDDREVVEFIEDGADWRIIDVLGARAQLDGATIDPGTTIDPEAITDGLPPDSSPTPTVRGTVGALLVTWSAISNHDPVTYELHVDTSAAFTPDATTLVAETGSTQAMVKALTDGTLLEYDVTYYVQTIAKDADGEAAPSTEASGSPVKVNSPDVAAEYVYAGTLLAEQIVGGSIEAALALLGSIATASAGSRVEFDVAGIRLYDSDDNLVVNLPTDPDQEASILADLIATSLTVYDQLTIRGALNEISKGSVLGLSSGLNDPTSPPSITVDWPLLATGIAGGFAANHFGLAHRSTFWATVFAFFGTSSLKSINATTGAATTLATLRSNFSAQGGVTYLGTKYYVLGAHIEEGHADHGKWYVLQLNGTTFAEENAWRWGTFAGLDQPPYRPAIGSDAGAANLLIARCNEDGEAIWSTYSPGGTFSATVNTGVVANSHMSGLLYGSFDFGATRVVLQREAADVLVFNTSGTRQNAQEWSRGNYAPMRGLGHDGSVFVTLSRDQGILYSHTADTWTTSSDGTRWASYTWRDQDSTGGTHETGVSTRKKFTMLKRAQVTISAPAIPDLGGTDDPDSVRIYLGKGSTDPGQSGSWLQASPAVGVTSATVSAPVFTGTNPPASNDFPDATPGSIANGNGDTLLDGDDLVGTYTPVVTASSIDPTTTGATKSGWYSVRQGICKVMVYLEVNSTWNSNKGTGIYSVSLPVEAATVGWTGAGTMRDVSAPDSYDLMAEIFDSARLKAILRAEPTTAGNPRRNFTHAVPVAPATGDYYAFTIEYPVA